MIYGIPIGTIKLWTIVISLFAAIAGLVQNLRKSKKTVNIIITPKSEVNVK